MLFRSGRILAVGSFVGGIVRFQNNGVIDANFTANANGAIYSVALNSDGAIYVAGDFTRINSSARARVARLNADGSVDPTFDPGRGPDASVLAMAIQPDGGLLIGGSFTNVNGVSNRGIARLRGSIYYTPIQIQNARLNPTGEVTFNFTSEAGLTYLIESSVDLKTWSTLANPIATGATTSYTDTTAPTTNRFYRVKHN